MELKKYNLSAKYMGILRLEMSDNDTVVYENHSHYSDVIMSATASQTTSLHIVYSAVYSGADQRNHQSRRHWPLWGEFIGDRWIPLTMGQ